MFWGEGDYACSLQSTISHHRCLGKRRVKVGSSTVPPSTRLIIEDNFPSQKFQCRYLFKLSLSGRRVKEVVGAELLLKSAPEDPKEGELLQSPPLLLPLDLNPPTPGLCLLSHLTHLKGGGFSSELFRGPRLAPQPPPGLGWKREGGGCYCFTRKKPIPARALCDV